MAELMLADATRKGVINARSLRLPIVLVRDASAAPTVSDLVASIVHEPLQGRDIECALAPNTPLSVTSVTAAAKALIKLSGVPDGELPTSRAINLPSLTATPSQMIEAVKQMELQRRIGKVTFKPDPAIQVIVDGWPSEMASDRALSLGIKADDRIDDVVHDYVTRKLGLAIKGSCND